LNSGGDFHPTPKGNSSPNNDNSNSFFAGGGLENDELDDDEY
jgi:hypothetical protein